MLPTLPKISWLVCLWAGLNGPVLVAAEPGAIVSDAGLDGQIEAVVCEALAAKKMPGCVVCLGNEKGITYLRAFGNKRVEPMTDPLEPMSIDTVFDLASLTKPIATATSAMLLVEQKKLELGQPVARYLPAFAANGKEGVTVEQLFVHTSGLIPDNGLNDYRDGTAAAWKKILALKPTAPPGERFAYSDMGFAVLGELVRETSGQKLEEFSRDKIFLPLGMQETMFLPTEELRRRAAPTERRDGKWIQGEVHDPRAFKLDGVAGHAGLFSTATDLSLYARMMLGKGKLGETRVMQEATWQEMTRGREVPQKRENGSSSAGIRGLGWDMRTGFSSNRGEGMSASAFGHGGFTGTGIWIDPEKDLFVIFLSNRVHPDGKGSVNPLIGRIGTLFVTAKGTE